MTFPKSHIVSYTIVFKWGHQVDHVRISNSAVRLDPTDSPGTEILVYECIGHDFSF